MTHKAFLLGFSSRAFPFAAVFSVFFDFKPCLCAAKVIQVFSKIPCKTLNVKLSGIG